MSRTVLGVKRLSLSDDGAVRSGRSWHRFQRRGGLPLAVGRIPFNLIQILTYQILFGIHWKLHEDGVTIRK